MTKVIKTLNPMTIMKRLSKMLEQSIQDSDDDYFYDRLYFMKKTFEHYSDEYLSNDVKDKVRVIDYDLESINVLINQVLRFGRIVYSTDDSTVYNFPKDETPKFYIKDIFSKKRTNTIKENMNKVKGPKI